MNLKLTICSLTVAAAIVAAPNPANATAAGPPMDIGDMVGFVVLLGVMFGGPVTAIGSAGSAVGNFASLDPEHLWAKAGFVMGVVATVVGGAGLLLYRRFIRPDDGRPRDGFESYMRGVAIANLALGPIAVISAAINNSSSSEAKPTAQLASTPVSDGVRVGPGLGVRIAS